MEEREGRNAISTITILLIDHVCEAVELRYVELPRVALDCHGNEFLIKEVGVLEKGHDPKHVASTALALILGARDEAERAEVHRLVHPSEVIQRRLDPTVSPLAKLSHLFTSVIGRWRIIPGEPGDAGQVSIHLRAEVGEAGWAFVEERLEVGAEDPQHLRIVRVALVVLLLINLEVAFAVKGEGSENQLHNLR